MLKDTYTGHRGLIYTCKFISRTKLATGSADRTIKIWDLYNRQCRILIILLYKISFLFLSRYPNSICRFKMS